MKFFESILDITQSISPIKRRSILISIDAVLLPISVLIVFWFQLNLLKYNQIQNYLWLFPGITLLGPPLYILTGHYKGLTRFAGSSALYKTIFRNILMLFILAFIGALLNLSIPILKIWILLLLVVTFTTNTARFFIRDILIQLLRSSSSNGVKVAIYGAGDSGAQLSSALRLVDGYKVELFIDDSPTLWGRNINDIIIRPPTILKDLKDEIDKVLIAIPSLNKKQLREIVKHLKGEGFEVLQIPSIKKLTSGEERIESLRPIIIEDLLGRDSVNPIDKLLSASINNLVVCVTGAGGSIGSELCQQIINLNPKELILIERSEHNLYSIQKILLDLINKDITIKSFLGNAANIQFVENIFKHEKIDVIFHAAAYKHVPLVERNPVAGIENNVLSTDVICSAAKKYSVSKVILISTDKAVRPTNVMGASKRLSEMIIQSYANESNKVEFDDSQKKTIYSMVRFGNVLGSSGSVVPLFCNQISKGGPITLTHPDIIRYFMTIKEAAELLLQASSLAEGGDLFLLDMGEPVSINDLAKQIIKLSGLKLRDNTNPEGDIEIITTGLRPGEKLYEELLINNAAIATEHPLIFKALEETIPPSLVFKKLEVLKSFLQIQDAKSSIEILQDLVPEWHRNVHNK